MSCDLLDDRPWEMTLTPHRPGTPIEFNMMIDPVSANGDFTGKVEDGGVLRDIRFGRCVRDGATGLTYISLIFELGGKHFSLAGPVTPQAASTLLEFSGSYVEIVRPADARTGKDIAPFEPGDTGTGAGQQSGAL